MINAVETLILEDKNVNELSYEEKKAYEFYYIIWKYILSENKYDYHYINISFKVLFEENSHFISKKEGVNYKMTGEGYEINNKTYFKGCHSIYLDNVLNTNIDISVLLELFKSDNLNFDIISEDEDFWIYLNISKREVNKIIDGVLIKNKILQKQR